MSAALFADNAFRGFIRTYGLMERAMNPFFAKFGLSGAQWGVLRALERAEAEHLDALSVTELSDRLIIRPPSVTGVVDRMVRDGLVTRQPLPSDLRVKQIRITAKARQMIPGIRVEVEKKINQMLAGLSAAEQSELQRLLAVMGEHLESMLIAEQSAGV